MNELFKEIPQVSAIIDNPEFHKKYIQFNLEIVNSLVKKAIDELREDIGKGVVKENIRESLEKKLAQKLSILEGRSLRPLVNATGIVLHTNLGRAPMAHNPYLNIVLENYSNLEFDLATGKRGKRGSHAKELIKLVTGAETGVLVNNNAAGLLLFLKVHAEGKEVLVSRGELIELGGSFRIPDVMKASGAKLVEVGTTNRTHLKDYEGAITENTAIILKVHPSNYKIRGFTTSPTDEELATLTKKHGLVYAHDIGSGLLKPIDHPYFREEPSCKEALEAGADAVMFSGDKLLGGTQAGFIVGKESVVGKVGKFPMMRSLRLSKAHMCMIEETLRLWLLPDSEVIKKNPVMRMISIPIEELKEHAKNLHSLIAKKSPELEPKIIQVVGHMGGGSLPDINFDSWAVELTPKTSAQTLMDKLREAETPVVARVIDDKVVLDVRTIFEKDDTIISESVDYACKN